MPSSDFKGPVEIVVKNYDFYLELTRKIKCSTGNSITLNTMRRIGDEYYSADLSVEHSTLQTPLTLKTTQHRSDTSNFHFILIAGDFRDKGLHIFRFDSSGHAHNNPDYYPLVDRQVMVPHFHFFDEQGYNIAYRTQFIVEYSTSNEIPDIKQFVNHFYDEARMIHEPGGYPVVRLREDTLPYPQLPFNSPPDSRKSDPLRHAEF